MLRSRDPQRKRTGVAFLKRLLRIVVLSGVWLLFIFLLFQGAGFIYFSVFDIKPVGDYGYPYGLIVPHEQLDYLYKPGYEGKFIGGEYHDIDLRINDQGFRDLPFDEPRDDAIVVLGDSVVFGSGVRRGDRFTERFQSLLGPREKTAVLNMGVNSYSMGHYLALAELEFFGVQPELVIIGFTLNDIRPMEEAGPARRFGRLKRRNGFSKPDWITRAGKRLDRTLAGRFFREAKTKLRSAFARGDGGAYHTRWMRSVVGAWQESENTERLAAEIDRLDELLTEKNVEAVYLLFPERNDLESPGEFALPRTKITELLSARGLPFCDPYEAFRDAEPIDDLFLTLDSVHFTPRGHQLLASQLSGCLTRLGIRAAD